MTLTGIGTLKRTREVILGEERFVQKPLRLFWEYNEIMRAKEPNKTQCTTQILVVM